MHVKINLELKQIGGSQLRWDDKSVLLQNKPSIQSYFSVIARYEITEVLYNINQFEKLILLLSLRTAGEAIHPYKECSIFLISFLKFYQSN
ncbi:MAG: hypothetical protein COV59_04035 [Candidatus Magasanikbacteria bacterium CG11_big_fil_rev_8_21_14_0_20_39_34]|uniref:Uncharacterized protein n=1 Tax=Candidatus Magasanikbacteria bacterium CG11_big_fil_rev_8_21_14_0_20_39_34 TaxID=1974653 RepID=A0A2H0N4J6_9BACT|nr:MAG: hypothetical protein COV59_04035 [Candidatus Magasanikbacteria bacterium CG11_big_fil_rev_8_21_14_0_20_39_34]